MNVWKFSQLARLGILCLALLATACGDRRGGSIPYDVQTFGVPDAPPAPPPDANYRIASGDTLAITVFQVEALTRDYVVDTGGSISMPLIGSLSAAGQTAEQLRTSIATKLNQRYMRNADVTVSIREAQGQVVTVDGAVRLPGAYPVRGPMTLIQAVAQARGTDDSANPRRVAVFRQIEGQRMAAAFDLTSIRRGEAPDPQIYAGDVVVVDGGNVRGIWQQLLQTLSLVALFRPY